MTLLDALESEMREFMVTRETSPVAVLIKQELAKKRMSRATLAAEAKISFSALEKGLSGQRIFSENAIIRMEEVLGITLKVQHVLSAPDELGGYARTSVSWLEGNYLTIRPSSKKPDDLFTYITDVTWNHERNHMVFHEMARLDSAYAQKGDVAIPHQTGHIYFTTNRHGQHRLMVMQRISRTGEMLGLLLTLQQEKGANLLPVSMPVVLLPVASLKEAPSLGVINPQHRAFDNYRGLLSRVVGQGFASILGR
jgi:transcriptional regulator with XRE-family HTH domain